MTLYTNPHTKNQKNILRKHQRSWWHVHICRQSSVATKIFLFLHRTLSKFARHQSHRVRWCDQWRIKIFMIMLLTCSFILKTTFLFAKNIFFVCTKKIISQIKIKKFSHMTQFFFKSWPFFKTSKKRHFGKFVWRLFCKNPPNRFSGIWPIFEDLKGPKSGWFMGLKSGQNRWFWGVWTYTKQYLIRSDFRSG